MTTSTARRIARVRPHHGSGDEQFFVANDAADFNSAQGELWTVIPSPFAGSAANQGSPFREGWEPDVLIDQADFTFLAPCAPANVLGMAHNFGAEGRALPPQAFHKAATSVVGPGEAIELRSTVGYVDPEAELTVVIGRKSTALTLDNAREAVLGFTIGNDLTARDLQKTDEFWFSAKSQDAFTPLGPWIVTELDEADLAIDMVLNGRELAPASTADLGWNVDEILVYLTSFMTLHPGDVILTGFPAETARIYPGDTVVCRVEGIGELRNPVAAAKW